MGSKGDLPISLGGYDRSKSSAFGSLYLNSTTGAFSFIPNSAAIEGLKEPSSVTFKITVTDGAGFTTSEAFTVALNGANDTPDLVAPASATLIETSDNDTFGDITGTLFEQRSRHAG